MLEKAFIFGRGQGLHQNRRDVVELDEAALLARRSRNIRDQLGLELIQAARRIVLQRNNLRDLSARELDYSGFLIEVRVRTREDFDGVAAMDQIISHGIRMSRGIVIAAAAKIG